MNKARKRHGLICIGKSVYAIGGDAKNTVEIYNIYQDMWTVFANLPIRIAYVTCALFCGVIWITGLGNESVCSLDILTNESFTAIFAFTPRYENLTYFFN